VTGGEDVHTTPAGTTDLLFQAPPSPPDDDLDAAGTRPADHAPRRAAPDGARAQRPATRGANLRMLKGARQAAAGMKISDDQIRAVLDDPQDVQPDPTQPHRTRLTRDGVTVTMGNDGMILRVTRRR
jgi:hypothetical protein